MKLKNEHVAHYFPYKLRINGIKNFEGIRVMNGSDNCDKFVNIDAVVRLQYKPILKSLKTLLEDILTYYAKVYYGEIKVAPPMFSHTDNKILFEIAISKDIEQYKNLQYSTILYLAKEHYDFQNLIDQGLAVDVDKIRV